MTYHSNKGRWINYFIFSVFIIWISVYTIKMVLSFHLTLQLNFIFLKFVYSNETVYFLLDDIV